jgi:excinuclease UvrABC helicase subunit UvrB
MNFNKKQPLFNLFDSFFGDKEKYESFYNQITNKLTPSIGSTKNESGVNEDGSKWYKTTFTSNDGTYTSTSYVSSTTDFTNNWLSTPTTTTETTNGLAKLEEELKTAISTENFEDAVKLRDKIKNYKNNIETYNEKQEKLNYAISTQNFEEAIKLRDELKKLS